ncbi:class I SAM-dependent methyltransferase [Clostridium estertheticum]|uniref:Methyltransferase domain-containing protein n=1 Tax=Clostridium estertheticum TaxID=238834 RepID=A0AA47ELY2_9CLOT|nr:class I SAM-dependent methyltransferase [Clostridium estertheticum]MBU3153611.1 methyltransferase domain-containing protein [Clostridium estertheticum]WAG61008.1 methyltransferase domain-containing protein [Clostridium estertheticum]
MNNVFKSYLENVKKPWGVMFYRVVWEQLSQITNSKILDFGSGLGITANHLAKNNEVVAIEPNADMVEMRICKNNYKQMIGDIEQLKQQEDSSFDLVVCHNVLEYAEDPKEIFREFYRVLRPNGIISMVKHNHAGRIMSKVIFENNMDEAIRLLNGGVSNVANFGQVNYYNINDITGWIGELDINIEKVLGIRTFFALHPNNEIRYDPIWQEKMFEVEMMVSDIEDYINISFYNHVLLKKTRRIPKAESYRK